MKRASLSLVGFQAADTTDPLIDIRVDAQRLRAGARNLRNLPSKKLSRCRSLVRPRKWLHELFVTCDTAHIRIEPNQATLDSLPDRQLRRSDETRVIFDDYHFFHVTNFPKITDNKQPVRLAP
jgi:hypothetical protein